MANVLSPVTTLATQLNALNAAYELPAGGNDVFALQSIATFGTLTVIAEGSLDGTNWVALPLWDVNAGSAIAAATGIAAAGKLVRLSSVGLPRVRLRVSAFTSGVAPILWTRATAAEGARLNG